MLASKRNGTLYTGVTRDLRRRLMEHRAGWSQFTDRYNVGLLVYFETHESLIMAQQRERTIKHWRGRWKLDLIEARNPNWRELSAEIPFD
ncbi:MAG: GIY-YIG nuclease family protein [Minwuia sp.]|nr:GIY-YIG nuclease family protein [Minwuia sp.]